MYGALVKLVLELVILSRLENRERSREDETLMRLIREANDIAAKRKFDAGKTDE